MSKDKQKEIRTYLQSGVGGTFEGEDSYDVVLKALSHSKIADISGEQFAVTLKAYGIVPDFVRAGVYRLVLPNRSNR